ncbi:MAG TPA: UvrD-helicase domain-containing protein [Nitrospira sp.]|nr:UvrD-helicase domain-containing protein [Nitrospira sp.]
MSSRTAIPDRDAREAAETTFDRNVVVMAGAGTGKTTLLVNRVVHLLMKEPNPVSITELIALTFTNKAATEMKVRLRDRLSALGRERHDGSGASDGGGVSVEDLQRRYGLTVTAIADRAGAALQDLEKAQIGTLHSFAAHLLRLHPLEGRVDPAFQDDDGLRFEEHFTLAWDLWLDQELGRKGTRHELWRALLAQTTVEDIRKLAYGLCNELIDLGGLQEQLNAGLTPALRTWILDLKNRAETLLQTHDRPKRRKVEDMLAASCSLLARLAAQGRSDVREVERSVRDSLSRDVGDEVAQWDEPDFREAKRIIETCQAILRVDEDLFNDLLNLIRPFADSVRASFADTGWLSFDGLLARARRLLWEHPTVRERIKREYRAVLVDEFQDTDPIQYELVLAVSEAHARHATAWQAIRLEPGKLFIVGDPKQSIYAFRRADIEAFDRVVEHITAQGGMVQSLTTNFRSDAAVLAPVNEIFDRLFVRHPLVQPANVRLEARPHRKPAALHPGVQLLVTTPAKEDEPFDAAGAVRAEGDVLARWLKEELLSQPHVAAGHVALLFRKLTQADAYLDALRHYGIPYIIEGEKHFYRRQEVIDFVNVLRVLDDPHDRVGLIGLLRSPLGGLSDRDLVEFHEAGLLWDPDASRLKSFVHARADGVRRLYAELARLRRQVPAFSLAEAIQLVFDRLPILELAAASLHGEQAVANLLKVKHTAASLSDRVHLTLGGFVQLMVRRLEEQPEEAESLLTEETSDAVRILTIHKAKGLEFPVVVLPGLHQGGGHDRSVPGIVYDWSSGTYGISLSDKLTLGAVAAKAKLAAREAAERRRVLYVGMTRAKELLVLSGGLAARSVGESVLDWLQGIGEGTVGDGATYQLQIGACAIPHRIIPAPARAWHKRALSNVVTLESLDPAAIARLWQERTARAALARTTPWHLSPTSLVKSDSSPHITGPDRSLGRDLGLLVGIVAHRLLEQWDFRDPADRLLEQIPAAVKAAVPPERPDVGPVLIDSLRDLLTSFARSEAYRQLRSATILGREVPFLMPWQEGQVMEGVIDVIYRLDGRIWIADYKTDRIAADEAPARARTYEQQAHVYRAAAERALGQPIAGFQFLFLHPAVTVEM